MSILNAILKREKQVLLGILLLTFLIYLPSLKYDFYPNLDDGKLILENEVVRHFPDNYTSIFTEFVYGLYHPLTTLSFIVDYQVWGDNPLGFRLHNLLLHLLNTLLVFFLVKGLSKSAPLSYITSLIFAIHPLHIESVIWISERKDVLFTFWFLAGTLAYLKYNHGCKAKWLMACYVFFVLSLLSKATAVVFPVVLLLIDYLKTGKISLRIIIAKGPFFILSLIFGLINIKAQNSIGFIQDIAHNYSFIQLITLPVYSFTYYITHLFLPLNLAAKHLYPQVINGQIESQFYLAWVWFMAIVLLLYTYRKNALFVFGMLFYMATIALTLKIVPTGNDIVSERYAYVPFIGLCISFGSVIIPFFKTKPKLGMAGLLGFTLLLSLLSMRQIPHWKNEISIWTQVIKTEPTLPLAYFERANAFRDKKQFTAAIADYSQTLNHASNFYEAYIHRGLCYYYMNENERAFHDFSQAITLEPKNAEGYYHRGNLQLKTEAYTEALADLKKSMALQIEIPEVWIYKGLAEKSLGLYADAASSISSYLKIKPANTAALSELATCYYLDEKYLDAEKIYKQILQSSPEDVKTMYLLANTLAKQERYQDAITIYTAIINKDPKFSRAYLNRGNAYFFSNQSAEACANWKIAFDMGLNQARVMLENYCP